MRTIRIGLAGNPNCGKTTIFNALTGAKQKVGNYAGVTVEKKEGQLHYRGCRFIITDLPGTYSLTAYSPDEVIARDFLLNEKPDVIVNVIDATNLERNLFLTLQLRELGLPMLAALNIVDQAEKMGRKTDIKALETSLGLPVVPTIGPQKKGLHHLLDEALHLVEKERQSLVPFTYDPGLEAQITAVSALLAQDEAFVASLPARWFALKLLEKDTHAADALGGHSAEQEILAQLAVSWKELEAVGGQDTEILVSEARYSVIRRLIENAHFLENRGKSVTERIDSVLIHPVAGLPIFLFLLWGVFQLTFTLGAFPQDWIAGFFGWLGDWGHKLIPEGMLQSLLVDGVLGGVGAVLSFIPLVIILFFFISLMEDTGYMARAAFLMDRFLHVFGLHGQSFMPMMMGFGCSVPAIMASRTLRSSRERIITVLVTPFMSCGAKLTVYVLLAGAFFPENPALAVMAMYLIGVVLALGASLVLRKTVLKGESRPFVMELPPYRAPTPKDAAYQMWGKILMYFRKAGTTILAASVLVWAATTFPKAPEGTPPDKAMEQSIAGNLGKVIEPVLKPLGFDWKTGIATVTGFAAKEVVVSTYGVLYSVSDDNQDNEGLKKALAADPGFSPLIAFNLMLFLLILAPCAAAQATITSELGLKWYLFYLVFTTVLAWSLCFGVYQLGTSLHWGLK